MITNVLSSVNMFSKEANVTNLNKILLQKGAVGKEKVLKACLKYHVYDAYVGKFNSDNRLQNL